MLGCVWGALLRLLGVRVLLSAASACGALGWQQLVAGSCSWQLAAGRWHLAASVRACGGLLTVDLLTP